MISAVEPQRLAQDLHPQRQAVIERLAALRKRLRNALAIQGGVWVLSVLLALVALSLGVDWWLRLSTTVRVPLTILALGGLAVLVYRKLIKPLRLSANDLDWAEVLDRRRPGVGESIANVLQLPHLLDRGIHASPSMIHATVTRQAVEFERVDLDGLINVARQRKLLWGLALLIAASVALPLIWPVTASLWARRWLLGSAVRWPQQTYVSVRGVNDGRPILAARGESLVLEVNSRPKFERRPSGWLLTGRDEPLLVEGTVAPASQLPPQVAIRYRLANGQTRQGNFTHFEGGTFRYELPPVNEPLHFSLTAGDDWLGPIDVEPIDRPSVQSLVITARTPGSKSPQKFRAGETESQLLFLPKTQLEMHITSRQDLAEAQLVNKDGPMRLSRLGHRDYVTKWEMTQPLTLELNLVGKVGSLSSKPYFLTIGLLIDRDPRVMVRSSGVGRRVTPQAQIPLALRVLDDFGVTNAALELERTGVEQDKLKTTRTSVDLGGPDTTQGQDPAEFEHSYTVRVAEHKAVAGNILKLRAIARDNCVLGAHTGQSRWLSFQVVTPEELFYEILTRQREQRARFAAAHQTSKGQLEALDRLEKPEDTAGMLRAHQVVSRQVWQIANYLDASLEEMKLNELGTSQTRDLLATSIIAPMRELHGKKLTAMRQELDRLATARSIEPTSKEQALKLQRDVIDTMQRILERMSQWESFVDVVNQLRQIRNFQQLLLKSTEKTQKDRTEDVFDK